MPKRMVIKVDEDLCIGCGNCVTSCAYGVLEIVDGKAKVVRESSCDGLGVCIGDCPTGALKVIEKEVPMEKVEAVPECATESGGCDCPSAVPQTIQKIGASTPGTEQSAMLTHWPVQLRLVPVDGKFFNDKDVVLVADCCTLAYGNLQKDYVAGKVVVMFCPKFDDRDAYLEKLASIFKLTDFNSLNLVKMEVPCCPLDALVREAMSRSGNAIPFVTNTFNIDGSVHV